MFLYIKLFIYLSFFSKILILLIKEISMSIYKSALFSALVVVTLSGCGGGGGGSSKLSDNDSSTNLPPSVYIGEDTKVQLNKPITIYAKASDPDGVISEIEWKKGDEVLATTLNITYTPTKVGTDILTLTVTDNDGASASDSIKLEVVDENIGDIVIDNGDPLPF